METKIINKSYYKGVVGRYMSHHLGEELKDYCKVHRVSYEKFMTVLQSDDSLYRTYLESQGGVTTELPLCPLEIEAEPQTASLLEDVSVSRNGTTVQIGRCQASGLLRLLKGLEVCHA